MVAKRKSSRGDASARTLARAYRTTARDAAKSEEARQKMARDIIELAVQNPRSRVRIAVHDLAKPRVKPKVSEYELSDPRAAALRLERFCNIRLPVPFWICATQCPIFIPIVIPGVTRFGYFLIFCDVNVCAGTLTCWYVGV